MAEDFIQFPPNSTGNKARTISETISGNAVHTSFLTFRQPPSFTAAAFNIAPGNNAYMMAVLNRNTGKVVRIWRANVYISSEAAVTGVLLKFEFRRISATVSLSGGTTVTAAQHDTNDSLAASIDIMTKPTNTITDSGLFKTLIISGDECAVSTFDSDATSSQQFPRDNSAAFMAEFPLVKPVVLRTNGTTHEGFAIKHILNQTIGNVGLEMTFTVDDQ